MDFNWNLVFNSLPLLIAGAGVTVQITLMSVGCGFFIGLILSLMNMSRFFVVRLISKCYVELLRGTPLLVQIFMIYFAVPQVINAMGITVNGQPFIMNSYVAAVLACSLNSGAYVAEIFRAGIQSINVGQMEAGRSLGLNWTQTMRHIVLPQAFKAIMPALGNEFIAMLKDTSLVSVIGFTELTRQGQLIIARTYGAFELWTAVAFLYLIMTVSISRLVAYLERRNKVK